MGKSTTNLATNDTAKIKRITKVTPTHKLCRYSNHDTTLQRAASESNLYADDENAVQRISRVSKPSSLKETRGDRQPSTIRESERDGNHARMHRSSSK